MYSIVYVDENNQIINIDDKCESVKITNNQEDLELFRNGYTELRIGCKVGRYFIYEEENNSFSLNKLLTDEMKAQSVDKSQFIYVEPEKVINLQEQYIKQLEEKISKLETAEK